MSPEAAVAKIQPAPLTNAMSAPKIVQAMFESGYWQGDVKSLAQAYVKTLAGEELGLTPFAAMTGITIIEGKLGMTANLMTTLLQENPDYDYRVKESSNTKATIEFFSGDESLGSSEFTIEDAERAGLVKPSSNWAKWPKAMCFARAMTQGIRTYCPVVTKGAPAYTVEELGADVNEAGDAINVSAPEPVESVAEVELDQDKYEDISGAFETIAPDLRETQLMLGACGIDSIDSIEDLDTRLRFLTDEEFGRLRAELQSYADREVAETDAEEVTDAEVVA